MKTKPCPTGPDQIKISYQEKRKNLLEVPKFRKLDVTKLSELVDHVICDAKIYLFNNYVDQILPDFVPTPIEQTKICHMTPCGFSKKKSLNVYVITYAYYCKQG